MLRSVANFAMDNIGNLVSANNIANTMTSDGRDINVRTVERYLEGFVESFFLYKASRYDLAIDVATILMRPDLVVRYTEMLEKSHTYALEYGEDMIE